MNELYSMISKRKSHRSFDKTRKLSVAVVEQLLCSFDASVLVGEKPSISIVDASNTSCPRGDLCLMYYGAKDEQGLVASGYYLEQLDLYLQANGIGVCWYGFGRTKDRCKDGKDFVIMLNLGYAEEGALRCSLSEFKRNDISSFVSGSLDERISSAIRLAPSACNSQPWLVYADSEAIKIKRGKGNISMLVGKYKDYFNLIDMGIFLYFLELSFSGYNYSFKRDLFSDDCIAVYRDVTKLN